MAAGGREGIRREDCPTKVAVAYPGKKSKNNPARRVLTKYEFIVEAPDIFHKQSLLSGISLKAFEGCIQKGQRNSDES